MNIKNSILKISVYSLLFSLLLSTHACHKEYKAHKDTFIKIISSPRSEIVIDMLEDEDGNMFANGLSYDSLGRGFRTIFKFSRDGKLLWQKMFDEGNSYSWHGASLMETTNHEFNFIILGDGGINGKIYHFDAEARIQKETELNLADSFGASYVLGTKDGGYVMAGSKWIYDPVQSYNHNAIYRTDANGKVLWCKSYGQIYFPGDGYCIYETPEGDLILAGNAFVTQLKGQDVFIVKTDKNGNEKWRKTTGTNTTDICSAIMPLASGNYFVWCGSLNYDWSQLKRSFYQFNKNGDSIGSIDPGIRQNLSALYWAYSDKIKICPDGGFLILGVTKVSEESHSQAMISKYDAGLHLQWRKYFNGNVDVSLFSAVQLREGGYFIAITSKGFAGGKNSNDIMIIKTDENGNY